jgi:hypothetical protein
LLTCTGHAFRGVLDGIAVVAVGWEWKKKEWGGSSTPPLLPSASSQSHRRPSGGAALGAREVHHGQPPAHPPAGHQIDPRGGVGPRRRGVLEGARRGAAREGRGQQRLQLRRRARLRAPRALELHLAAAVLEQGDRALRPVAAAAASLRLDFFSGDSGLWFGFVGRVEVQVFFFKQVPATFSEQLYRPHLNFHRKRSGARSR